MKSSLSFSPIFFCIVLFSCQHATSPAEISGNYVYEDTFTDHRVPARLGSGVFTVRDTITLVAKESGFEASGSKWRRNHYDTLGWNRMEDRMYSHKVSFDKTDSSLLSEMSLYPPMYLDLNKQILYRSKNSTKGYQKIGILIK